MDKVNHELFGPLFVDSIDETVRNPQSEKPGAPSQGVGLGAGGRGGPNTRQMVRNTI